MQNQVLAPGSSGQSTGFLGHSERLLCGAACATCNAALKSANFACKYPALTAVAVASGVMLIPPCRHFVVNQTGHVLRKLGKGVQAIFWSDFPKKMEELDSLTHGKLREHTESLAKLKVLLEASQDDHVFIKKEVAETHTDVTKIDEHVIKMDAKVEACFAELERARILNEQTTEILRKNQELIDKTQITIDKLTASMQQGNRKIEEKIDNASLQQKELFEHYAQQFNSRFDSLASSINAINRPQTVRPATCGQAYISQTTY